MSIPLRIGLEDAAEQSELLEELQQAQDLRLEWKSEHLANGGEASLVDSQFGNATAQLDPRYAPVVPPTTMTLVPGSVTWMPGGPYSYKRIAAGASLCWARSGSQQVDESNGRMLLRACSPASNPVTDNASGQLGTIVTVRAGQQAEIIFSWVAKLLLDWDLGTPQDWVNLGVGIGWEAWSWNAGANPGQKVSLVDFGPSFNQTWSPTGSSWGQKGSRSIDPVPAGQSNILTRAKIQPPAQDTTYCVFLDVWL